MSRLPAGWILLLATAVVTLMVLLLGQTPWAHSVRESMNTTTATPTDPSGVAALVLPFGKVILVMTLPGLLAIGGSHLARHLARRKT